MDGMDEASQKVAMQARGCKHLAEAVNGLRGTKGVSFDKEVKKVYKLMAAGRYEEPAMSVEEIMKKEFPDGSYPKPWGSTI
mmetsp:Transcript_24578/g.51072  ORF Transcript_24578/g.51072 Transcript_24578/m.51072 type:complete len:81 (-) Transcript_24578:127-369(-)